VQVLARPVVHCTGVSGRPRQKGENQPLHRVVSSMKPWISARTRSRIASFSINSSCLPSGRATRRQSSSRRQNCRCSSPPTTRSFPLQQQDGEPRIQVLFHQLPRGCQGLVDPPKGRGLDGQQRVAGDKAPVHLESLPAAGEVIALKIFCRS